MLSILNINKFIPNFETFSVAILTSLIFKTPLIEQNGSGKVVKYASHDISDRHYKKVGRFRIMLLSSLLQKSCIKLDNNKFISLKIYVIAQN
jgi:hypothetical protein